MTVWRISYLKYQRDAVHVITIEDGTYQHIHLRLILYQKSHGIYQSHEIEGHNKGRPFRENVFRQVPLFPVLLQKPWLLQKPFIWKKCQFLQDLPLVRVVGYEITWNTVFQLLVSGQTLTHSLWMMIHLGWRAGHTAAWVGGSLTPRAMILFQRGSRRRTFWDMLLIRNETQNNSVHIGTEIIQMALAIALEIFTSHLSWKCT